MAVSNKYSCSSLLNARSAIQYRLASVHCNIINKPDIVMANKILDGVLKQKKQSGDEAVIHRQPISDDDWQQIMKLFKYVATRDNPRLITYYLRFW